LNLKNASLHTITWLERERGKEMNLGQNKISATSITQDKSYKRFQASLNIAKLAWDAAMIKITRVKILVKVQMWTATDHNCLEPNT
jgi:hypothetical protein